MCAPFISTRGVEAVAPHTPGFIGEASTVLTNLSAEAIAAGAVDPVAVRRLTATLPGCRLVHLPRLHAKVYAIDTTVAFVTSANLTTGGLYSNLEYGVAVRERALVERIRSDILDYATLGANLNAESLDVLCDVATEIGRIVPLRERALPEAISERIRGALRQAGDEMIRSHLAGGPVHAVFARTIRFVLARQGPSTTEEIHRHVQRIHPDLCDDSVDRIIDGQRFGKKWKHAVRTAQQQLKRQQVMHLGEDRRWRLTADPYAT